MEVVFKAVEMTHESKYSLLVRELVSFREE